MNKELDKGNMNVAYCASHTYKHKFTNPTDRDSKPIIDASLTGLWELRFHPRYYSYPNTERSRLGALIAFREDLSELDSTGHLSFGKTERDSFRLLASPSLIIPDITEYANQGILTDVVTQTREKIQYENKLIINFDGVPDPDGWRKVAERVGTTLDNLLEARLDNLTYALFIVGYTLPRLDSGTEAEKRIEKGLIKDNVRLENPIEYIEKLIGKRLE